MSQLSSFGKSGGSGTVTSISESTGIVLTPNPITSTGTVAVSSAVALSYLTDDTNSAIPATNVLTIHGGAGVTTSSSGSTVTITATGGELDFDGDTGTATPSAGVINFKATSNSGSSVVFAASSATVNLKVTDSNNNTLIGVSAGNSSLSGSNNTGLGDDVLHALTSGGNNAALGFSALADLTSGSSNTAVGYEALDVLLTGTNNIAIGASSGSNYVTSESSNIVIGAAGTASESNVLRIGTNGSSTGQQNKCFIAGVAGVNVGSVATVVTEASNQLGTAVITAGTGITVTPAANTITIASTVVGGIQTIDGDSGSMTGTTVTISGGTTGLTTSASSATMDLTGTLVVGNGGTGNTTFTAYSVICAGTTATGAFQNVSGLGTSGQVLTSQGAGALPQWATGASGFTWSVITADQSAAVANGYICNKAGLLTLTLPTTAAAGTIIEVTGMNTALGWKIAQNSSQQIFFGTASTTVGTGGSLASSAIYDSVKLVCNVANTSWIVLSSVGNISYV